jgi:hypothetical protein
MDTPNKIAADECTSADAARELGIAVSTLNQRRRRIAQYFDSTSRRLLPVEDVAAAADARRVRDVEAKYVCLAPALGGFKVPGADWTYSRHMLRLYTDLGLGGVAPHAREWTRNTLEMLGLAIGIERGRGSSQGAR